ncbi:protein of unknown function [Georgenia satyanarayanai]|uniref:DUF1206 domain-containing protein n=1 Tax=Georgenia satyanarayanai TaxID=860221 RepID=A0A2Y9AC30_9MICO|nr:DUF1206 domain-containing protein [Georgenia satyanarayanai]PYG00086.1 uncharacterized protein DUF1206 [Georgenia satyanarayanai]SSA40109.1 protein of unknown function [Georgenia satyanarayanai]
MNTVRGTAAELDDHPALTTGARLGYAASGVLHLVLGWTAVGLAWGTGGSGESADQSGALEQLGSTPLGAFLLWVVVAGFTLLTLWQVATAVATGGTKDRLNSVGKAATYLVLTGLAARAATGKSGGGGSEQTTSLTARVMEHPLGQVAVGLVGLGVVVVGGYHVVKGWRERFLEDLRGNPGRAVTVAGRVGYIAKGIALGIVGALFVVAAVQNDPEEAKGLDGALRSLLELPLGTALLTAVGLGIAAYGVYSFGRARHARV